MAKPTNPTPIACGCCTPSAATQPSALSLQPSLQARLPLILVILAGVFLLLGVAAQPLLGLPPSAALVFYLLAYAAGGYEVAAVAIPSLLRRQFDTDVLMLAAALGAAVIGEWAEGAFLLFLFSLAHVGEQYALGRARKAIHALGALMPHTARVRRGDDIVEEDVTRLEIGDVVVVRPGDRLPTDGVVISGESAVDQSAITGESVPVAKSPGDEVFAGTVNGEAALDARVTKLAKDNTLSRILQLVAEAESQQSPTQQMTNRFMRWFVPAVLVGTALVAAVPPLLGWLPFQQSFYRAMLLLVGASPCALALGAPAAVLAGVAQAARNGVLIKGGAHLENLGALQVIAFDKTGTLTEGRFRLTDVVALNGAGPDEIVRLAAAVEQQSSHPLALAVTRAAQERALTLPAAEGLENVAGLGVRSTVGGRPLWIGSPRLFHQTAHPHPALDGAVMGAVGRLADAGKSVMIVSHDHNVLGVLGLADVPRSGIRQTLDRLRRLGVHKLVMLSGDHHDVARKVAAEVGVTEVQAGLLPEQKLEAIRQLRAQHGAVAMIGDGINDAPALATATVGIAMGTAGTAVALETADVALMGDDLGKLPFAVSLGRATRAIIQQNLAIALGVIALLIVSSLFGLLPLSAAVTLHEGSTIVVILNALRLLGHRAA